MSVIFGANASGTFRHSQLQGMLRRCGCNNSTESSKFLGQYNKRLSTPCTARVEVAAVPGLALAMIWRRPFNHDNCRRIDCFSTVSTDRESTIATSEVLLSFMLYCYTGMEPCFCRLTRPRPLLLCLLNDHKD